MFGFILGRFRRKPPESGSALLPDGFETLNRQAPLVPQVAEASSPRIDNTLLCRETILGRDQRIAGYRFTLGEATRNRIRRSTRLVHHVYAEVLVGSLLQHDIGRLLEHRKAFVHVPDSFLGHPCLRRLPPANTVFVLQRIADGDDPASETMTAAIRELRQAGFGIGVPDSHTAEDFSALLPLADVVVTSGSAVDPEHAMRLVALIADSAAGASLLISNVNSMDEFRFFHSLGAKLFHGPFITSRQTWQGTALDPDVVHAKQLLDALRKEADTDEIVRLTKENPGLSLRLLRYVNAASGGVASAISSIERAVQIVGRDQLYRWVLLILCSRRATAGRTPAALESAMVRARTMELLGAKSPRSDQEALFLVGLLSLIDVIFEAPMKTALAALAVAPEIEGAILDSSGPYADLLALAVACEGAEAEHIRAAAERCEISPEIAADRYMKALWWTLDARM